MNDSRQINSSAVIAFLLPHLGDPSLIPGTPRWCAMSDDDPRKRQACYWPVVWWAIAEEGRQTAMADASKAVASSVDWPRVAREIQQLHAARRSGARIDRVGGGAK